ncbi:11666_t:CDS:2 [Paraglomus brasilianum]|uniref:11666_t:CDS:1 n=1 Tax=Paraglomus brasilianum TaxID=144538 RepID=A0A9N9FJ93_9GLOM|nr:11666_t:CDS:2 [Paraglomus brasilianum]
MTRGIENLNEDAGGKEIHFVVWVHGLWGNPGHLEYFVEQLDEKHGDQIHILNAKCNTSEYTYDGVDICGERLTEEIMGEYKVLKDRNYKVTKFSIIGYSLGGLVSRYAIGALYDDGFFKEVEPLLFTTFATPHLGIRREDDTTYNKVFNWISSHLLSKTGEQLQLIDKYEDGKPLIHVLADPGKVFYKALSIFKYRKLYANTYNDRTVPFWTAAIVDVNPFDKMDKLNITIDKNWPSIIESIQLKEESSTVDTMTLAKNVPRYIIAGVAAPIVVPIWLTFALSTLTVQSAISRRRVQQIINTRTREGKHVARVSEASPFSIVASDIEEGSIEAAMNIKSLFPSGPTSPITESAGETLGKPTGDFSNMIESCNCQPLLLLQAQKDALKHLNNLKWEKHSVYIDTLNAHGAIVVRNKRFYSTGKDVVRHFVDKVFVT